MVASSMPVGKEHTDPIMQPRHLEETKGFGSPEFCVIQRAGMTPVSVCRQPLPASLKPRQILEALEGAPYLFLLESADGPLKTARYSIIGCAPFITLKAKHSACLITNPRGQRRESRSPAIILRELLAPFRVPRQPFLPVFYGGAVGLFSYDMKNYFEELSSEADDDLDTPDCFIVFVDTVVLFDRLQNTSEIIASEFHASNLTESHAKAHA